MTTASPARVAARALKITVGEVAARLRKDPWHDDRTNPSYVRRNASFYAVFIHQFQHTGTKSGFFTVGWYTGNPARRWASRDVDTIQEAVALANLMKPDADRVTAEEMGENPEGQL